MSDRYVAFLRSINVGNRRIAMDELRETIEAGGFADVETYRASGNVVFDADGEPDEAASALAGHLGEALGYEVPVFLRTTGRLAQIVNGVPFEPASESGAVKDYVVFVDDTLSESQRVKLAELATDVDTFRADGRDIYWRRQLDAGDSMPTSDLEKALDLTGTRRTLGTVERIADKWA